MSYLCTAFGSPPHRMRWCGDGAKMGTEVTPWGKAPKNCF